MRGHACGKGGKHIMVEKQDVTQKSARKDLQNTTRKGGKENRAKSER